MNILEINIAKRTELERICNIEKEFAEKAYDVKLTYWMKQSPAKQPNPDMAKQLQSKMDDLKLERNAKIKDATQIFNRAFKSLESEQ